MFNFMYDVETKFITGYLLIFLQDLLIFLQCPVDSDKSLQLRLG